MIQMKINDLVNIKSYKKGEFWKGRVEDITTHDGVCNIEPIYSILGLNNISHALVYENEVIFKDGEYWEV